VGSAATQFSKLMGRHPDMIELGWEELANGELLKATNAGSLCTVGKATDGNANCLGCSPILRPERTVPGFWDQEPKGGDGQRDAAALRATGG
jgi:hypothetical protein